MRLIGTPSILVPNLRPHMLTAAGGLMQSANRHNDTVSITLDLLGSQGVSESHVMSQSLL